MSTNNGPELLAERQLRLRPTSGMRWLTVVLVSIWSVVGTAQTPPLPGLLKSYENLRTYCDKGSDIDPHKQKRQFERCARRDGRFMDTTVIADNRWRNLYVMWADGATMHRYQALAV